MQWLARGEPSVPVGDAWLTEVEVRRSAGMRFTKRRTEYRLRRYVGKCAVAEVLGLSEETADLARIGVLNAPTGAPFVQVDGQRIGMDVSLTDRAGWAVCLVAADPFDEGVDVVIVEPRSDGFVRDFLTPAEQTLVRALPDADARAAAANLIWSAKESALKVLRTGLRADTRTVEIAPADPDALVASSLRHSGAGRQPRARNPRPDRPAASAGTPGEVAHTRAWHPLTARTVLGELPGWWRRDGLFVLTVVTGSQVAAPPPTRLPGSADLVAAPPIHSWTERPLAD